MEYEFESWTDEALQDFLNAVAKEQRRRRREQQEISWNQVRQAIADYIEKFGEIEFYDDGDIFYLDRDRDLSTFGEIH